MKKILAKLKELSDRRPIYKYLGILAGFIFCALFLLFILDEFLMPVLVKDSYIIKTPNVVGSRVQDAQTILAGAKLESKTIGEQNSDEFPAGAVIKQTPDANSEVKAGRKVYLMISKGKQSIVVPNIVGKFSRDARLELIRNGMQIGKATYIPSDSIQNDIITWQSINPGTNVSPNTLVDVIISQGSKADISAPQLLNLSLEEAKATVGKLGLVLGTVSYIKDETYLESTVRQQDPPAQTLVKVGSAINITIVK